MLNTAEPGMNPAGIRMDLPRLCPRTCFILVGFICAEGGKGRWNHYIVTNFKTTEFKDTVKFFKKCLKNKEIFTRYSLLMNFILRYSIHREKHTNYMETTWWIVTNDVCPGEHPDQKREQIKKGNIITSIPKAPSCYLPVAVPPTHPKITTIQTSNRI